MTSHINIRCGLRLLAIIPLLVFAHKGMAGDFISVGAGSGVPPATKAPTSATTSSSSIPQLPADPSCNNNPCLKAAEPIYRPEGPVYSGSYTEKAINYGAKKVVEKGLEKGLGMVIGTAASAGASVVTGVFATTKLGDATLPPEIQQQWNVNQQKKIDAFNKMNQQNVQAKHEAEMKKQAEQVEIEKQAEANKQAIETQQAVGGFVDALNLYVDTKAQQQMQQQTSATAPESTTATSSQSCNKTYSTPDGCHPGHDENSHPGGCRCG